MLAFHQKPVVERTRSPTNLHCISFKEQILILTLELLWKVTKRFLQICSWFFCVCFPGGNRHCFGSSTAYLGSSTLCTNSTCRCSSAPLLVHQCPRIHSNRLRVLDLDTLNLTLDCLSRGTLASHLVDLHICPSIALQAKSLLPYIKIYNHPLRCGHVY